MLNALSEFLQGNAVGMLFLVLGLGYLVGKTSIRGFNLGSISGVLFVGLVFGHYGYSMHYPASMRTMFFNLFIHNQLYPILACFEYSTMC